MDRKMRILWIDDEIEHLKPYIYMLSERGYEVNTATNGPDGIEMVKKKDYDLVLVDEMMPGIDGMETLQHIKKENEDIIVAIVTKIEDEKLIDEAYGKFADDFVIKPFTPSQFLASIKRLLEKKEIARKNIARIFAEEIRSIPPPNTWKEWIDYYRIITRWRLRLKRLGEKELKNIEEEFSKEANIGFGKFVEERYPELFKKNLTTSCSLLKNHVFDFIKKGEKVLFLLFDSMRLDQYFILLPFFREDFNIKTEYYISILPSATPYSRNAIFSGMMPAEILKNYPAHWVWEEEGQNRYEDLFFKSYLEREGINQNFIFKKITRTDIHEKTLTEIIASKEKIKVIIVNFLDVLLHSVTRKHIVDEIFKNEYAFLDMTRTWFLNSIFPSLIEKAKKMDHIVFLTTDHGFIKVKKPLIIHGGRFISKNLRYKYGAALRADKKGCILLHNPAEFFLPVPQKGMRFAIAKEDYYFIYPTKPKEYEIEYKYTYQHGGISLDEMILPIGEFIPK